MNRLWLSLALSLVLSPGVHAQETAPWPLFDGVSLKGWSHHLDKPSVKMEDVWSVEEGVLKCKGRPAGYIVTDEAYENYKLVVEWRWPSDPGNNGVLVHCTDQDELGVWPKSLEVQLGSGNAGDFWTIGTTIKLPEGDEQAKRIEGRRHLNLTDDSENPPGEWNSIEVVCQGDHVTVHVNGDLVNECDKVSQTKGQIALQSEGAPIEFRKVELTPLASTASPAE